MPIVIDPPSSPPVLPPADDGSFLWEELYAALGYHRETDAATGYALRAFCEAWCSTLQPVYEIVRERNDGPAWGILLDVDECPAASLPYLAQYVGMRLTPEMSEEQIREEIREPTGWARGRLPSIRFAGQRTLTGSRRVIIRPRTPKVGIHYIRTLLSETPKPSRTEAAFRAALPAWEPLDYEAIAGVTWADIVAGWDDLDDFSDLGDPDDNFDNFADLADTLPDELPEP
jgi:hypothetical protein